MNFKNNNHQKSRQTLTRRAALAVTTGGLSANMLAATTTAQQSRERWNIETDASGFFSPTVVDETVFVGTWDGTYYALDADSGEIQWEFEITSQGTSPTVADGTLYIGSEGNRLYAINTETGEQEWKNDSFSEDLTQPVVSNGTVFAGNRNGLYALDAATGEQDWFYRTFVNSSPAVANETVFVGNWEPNIHAVDTTTGERQWVFRDTDFQANASNGDLPLSSFKSPVVASNTLFGTVNSTLYAIETETGNQRWTYQSDTIFSSPTMADDSVLVGGGKLHAVDTETGDRQWAFEPDTNISSMPSPAVDDGTVYIGASNVYALNVETGDKLWTVELFDQLTSPATGDNSIFVGNEDGKIYAFDTTMPANSADASGSLLSNITLPGAIRGTVVSSIFGYGLYQLVNRRGAGTDVSQSGSADTTSSDTTTDSGKQDSSTEDATVDSDQLQERASELLTQASGAKSNGEYQQAADAYEKAISRLEQAAVEADEEANAELNAKIAETQVALDNLTAVREERDSLRTNLNAAERNFKEGIARYAADEQTVARIRFRQARDAFNEAQQSINDSDTELLTSPIEVNFEAEATLPSMARDDLAVLEESTLETLSAGDIESITDLEANTAELTPAVVTDLRQSNEINDDEAELLTILSWWYEGDNREFTSEDSISRRYEQADYGFNQST